MQSICLNFQVNQPFQYRTYRFFDIGTDSYYANDFQNKYITGRSTERCYIHANNLLLKMIKEHGDFFKVSFTISGISLDLFKQYSPEVIDSFKALAETGNVEFLATPYYRSLASISSKNEFIEQTLLHKKRIEELFGVTPKSFSNTGLIYSDEIGKTVYEMGFESILTEGAKHVLGWKSPNFVYQNALEPNLKVLLRNFQLSDDVAFNFSNHNWPMYPFTAEKFAAWMNTTAANQNCVNLCVDYRFLGEWQDIESGILNFLEHLPEAISKTTDFKFRTPTELASMTKGVAPIYVPHPISWALGEKDLSIWIGNDLQKEAFRKLHELEPIIKSTENHALISQWRYLQNVDQLYWMNTKQSFVHGLHNPFQSPFEAFINFMNIVSDLALRAENSVFSNDTLL